MLLALLTTLTLLAINGSASTQQDAISGSIRISQSSNSNSTHAGHARGELIKRFVHNEQQLILDDSEPHFEPLTSLVNGATDSSTTNDDISSASSSATNRQQQSLRGKRTLYACEEKELQIECQLGESIQLIRANYGRFSIQICNEHGQLDWKVNCMSASSTQIIANSCQAKQSCQLLASNSIFGDACPGTQKYLEVHYQCVPSSSVAQAPANRSLEHELVVASANSRYQPAAAHQRPPSNGGRPNVIQSAQQDSALAGDIMRPASGPRWSPAPPAAAATTADYAPAKSQAPPLPHWMMDIPLQQQQPSVSFQANASRAHCPEAIFRQIRWPASEPGLTLQMPCPAHAYSSQPSDSWAAVSLTCSGNAQWAPHAHAAHCQSVWLRNLTQRLEAGDSPLSALAEMVHRTRASTPPPLFGASQPQGGLFGEDLAQLARVVRKLADEMGELLNRIADDKQRVAFAREMLQSLIELINNLSQDEHQEAWLDLAQAGNERQRIAGQFLQGLESVAIHLANVTPTSRQNNELEENFVKVTDQLYLTIKAFSLPAPLDNKSTSQIEVSFPSESTTLGTKWMNLEQRFTLRLQQSQQLPSANLQQTTSQVDVKQLLDESVNSPKALKIVFVMIKGLGTTTAAQMEAHLDDNSNNRMVVNSNLVSLSIVADTRYKSATPIKVDLSAPIELVFRHLSELDNGSLSRQSSRCVYWDTSISEWQSEGCRLVETNKTHTSCACNHLTTFAVLSERDQLSQHQSLSGSSSGSGSGASLNLAQASVGQNQQQPHLKVQLDSVENELILPNKLLYLAKMLDGHLFLTSTTGHSNQQQNTKLLIYISCLISAALLAIYLAALAYNRAHARRLLGAIPAHPPPPLLVTNTLATRSQHASSSTNSDASPTYSSDYSAALAASKSKLQQSESIYPSATLNEFKNAHKFNVPVHLIAQLLILELLLVFLVESQNYLERNRRNQQYQSITIETIAGAGGDVLNPIGVVTWLVVLALYYLIVSLTFWLIGQLLRLNLNLILLTGSPLKFRKKLYQSNGNSNAASSNSDKSYNGAFNSANPVGVSIYGGRANLYGATSAFYAPNATTVSSSQLQYNQHQGVNSSTSPTSSYSSGDQSADQNAALNRLEDSSARLYGGAQTMTNTSAAFNGRPLNVNGRQLDCRRSKLSLTSRSVQLVDLLVVHVLPILSTTLIGWLSANKSQSLNTLSFTSSMGSQLACWPLLVDASGTFFSVPLYYGPAVCLILLGLTLFMLTRVGTENGSILHRNRASSSRPEMIANSELESSVAQKVLGSMNQYGASSVSEASANPSSHTLLNGFLSSPEAGGAGQLNKQQTSLTIGCQNHHQQQHKANSYWQAADLKKAKFVCLILGSLAALHALSWITFFAHLHQALNSNTQASPYLLYAFAGSNLTLVLLIVWSQGRALRRAAQLAGLTRLLAWLCLPCSGAAHSFEAAQAAKQRSRFYRAQQQQQQQQVSRATEQGLKMPASSQSLFLISQQQQQYGNYHYGGQAYSSAGSSNNQQHLYQQLGQNQQHIYDSTSAINLAAAAAEQQQRASIMQLAQQRQQLEHQHFNRSMNSLHHTHLQAQRDNFQLDSRAPMTLKPMMFGNQQPRDLDASCQLLVLDAQSALKQQQQFVCQAQQQQQDQKMSGEADGPLVALGGLNQSASASQTQAAFAPRLQQTTTQRQATEHQLFSSRQQELLGQATQVSPINCISGERRCSTSGANNADANQHQYYSVRPNAGNYADALKAAMVQHQQQQQHQHGADLHHFRRSNSKQRYQQQQQRLTSRQSMIDRSEPDCNESASAANIYDVATNYIIQTNQ